MSNDNEPNVITSPLSREITGEGISVKVEIYRLEGTADWVLELIDADWNSMVWEETFPTDQDAWDYLQAAIEREGLTKVFMDEDSETVH